MTDTPSTADTATLLAAGLQPARAGSRWQPPAIEELQGAFPNLEIIALLGMGGMGAVYLARQQHLDRKVALKLLDPSRANDSQFDERFTREARALARLDHPNIIHIHDFGRIGPRAFLVMEFIEGSNLRQVMATGALSGAEALRLVSQLCDALAHAHAAGVVHRDLKPENIMIDGRGDAHIADFGLAKLAESGMSITGTGEILGTLHYMAPEQLAATGSVDHRVDLYALGVITYEMLTGSLPLGRFDPPSVRSGVAAAVDPVVLRSLEPDPTRRYNSAVDLAAALAQAGGPAKPAPRPYPGPAAAAGPAPGSKSAEAAAAADAAEAPTRADDAKIPEIVPPKQRPEQVSISLDGIHVVDGEDEVHIGLGGINVQKKHSGNGGIGGQGVRKALQAAFAEGPSSNDGKHSLYSAGMLAIFLGSAIAVGFGSGRLFDFLAAPTSHFAADRVGDLAMLVTPAYIAGGIALISRCCLPMVIISGIAELMLVPWLWQEHSWLFWVLIWPMLWHFQTIFHFKQLRSHMASLAWHGRLLRLVWVLPIVCLALAAPVLPWLAHNISVRASVGGP